MNRLGHVLALGAVLLAAAWLRLTHLDWDGYYHYHPDERYLGLVATTIEAPRDWAAAFRPHQSPFNPFYWAPGAVSPGIVVEQDEPRRFAYGHLPLYLGVAFGRLLESVGPDLARRLPSNWLLTRDLLNGAGRIEFHYLTAAGRALTGLVDVATVGLTYLIGRWAFRPAVGLLAAALLAVNVMHIQLAHFFTVDPYLTFFVTLALAFMLLALSRPHRSGLFFLLAGAAAGLAVGSKFTAVLLVVPLAVAAWLTPDVSRRRQGLAFAGALAAGLLAFGLTNPFAFLDLTCNAVTPAFALGPIAVPALDWRSCYLQNVSSQALMVRGVSDVPFVRQYASTLPYLYHLEMQLKWGMGPILALAAFAGLTWASLRALRSGWLENLRRRAWPAGLPRREVVLLAWALPFLLSTSALQVKFMRYLQPVTPILMVYAAAVLLSLRPGWLRGLAAGLTLLTTAGYALAFANMYQAPHPWLAASRWIFQNAEPGTTITAEAWDDPLPDNIELGGALQRRDQFELKTVNWLSGTGEADNSAKLMGNLEILAESDYLVLASNRNYGVIPRLPGRYPLSSQYYPRLMDGSLGFEAVHVVGRAPNLWGFQLKGDTFAWPGLNAPPLVSQYLESWPGLVIGRADESFTVYDHPLTIIFEKVEVLSAAKMAAAFEGVGADALP
ncbi:MAG: glycosyltransferase family 39 protein [Candidatus Promineifilaceae bacterium]